MIIMVRGNNGSGKSTAVRNAMKLLHATPVYGSLGMKVPEAYCCFQKWDVKRIDEKAPRSYVLGPYQTEATCGFDYITKLGVKRAEEILEKYRLRGNVVFESIMTSMRILEPSLGKWMNANKTKVLIATLDTTYEECLRSVEARKLKSVNGTRWNSKHLEANQRMIDRVTQQYTDAGFRMEYVSRDSAPEKIVAWLKEKSN